MHTAPGSSNQPTAAELRQQFANNLSSQISNIGSHVVGRSVPVVAGGATKAYARLNRILSDNNIRRELSLRRRYEKPKYKRQRLRQESHARRFKEEVKQKVHLIMKMKNWGIQGYSRLNEGGHANSSYSDIESQRLANLEHARHPSSDETLDIANGQPFDEEDDARFYDEFTMYDPHDSKVQVWRRKRFTLLHICLVAVGCLGVYAGVSALWRALSSGHSSPGLMAANTYGKVSNITSSGVNALPVNRSGKKLLTYDTTDAVNAIVERKSLNWIKHPTDSSIDGLYRELKDKRFLVHKIDNSTWEHELATFEGVVRASKGLVDLFQVESWSVSADWEYILFNTHSEHVWRHSVKGTYFLYSTKERTMVPLTEKGNGQIQRVEWAPTGHRLLFVYDNDLYVTDMMHEIRVTQDGSDKVFNGIADWVYEEEVLSSGASSWWSPDGEVLAYLRLDDSKVPIFQYELFHPENRSIVYPDSIRLHYPKPGAANPLVSLHVYRPDFKARSKDERPVSKASDNPDTDFRPQAIRFDKAFKPEDNIITSVTWLTDKHSKLLVYTMNRVQDHARIYLASASPKQLSAKLVRERSTSEHGQDGAWIEITSPPIYVPAHTVDGLSTDAYIDLVENGEHVHLALFAPLDADKPATWLTSGDWDVVSGSATLNRKTAQVSFMGTRESSIRFNLYQVSLNSKEDSQPRALSPPTLKSSSERLNKEDARNGTYGASFSSSAGFYLLSYKGPNLPWQAVYSSTDQKFERVLVDNAAAQNELDGYELPAREFFEINNDVGDKMNAMATYPPGFDKNANRKYGVLFRVYGGPSSQLVSQSFVLDWHSALVSQQDVPDMPWIVVTVDGRGTGYKGRKFRSCVSKQLGILETDDQAAAARYFQKLPYVNPERIAIWGWSYGGYMTSRTLERHSDVFRVGMAVAPVTDWRFYDSVYTERYMKTPQVNPKGYADTAVTNSSAFRKTKYLVQHGTGDDNVHLQNTLALVDLLESNNVPGFEMATYTDSDHSIYTHNVRPALYARMTNFLFRSFHELENKEFDFWRHANPNAENSK
ncbi:Dpp4p [Dipsacomyces acuminosporus]|nr:Dpp4p [Dipsacomyces acuminosporus]